MYDNAKRPWRLFLLILVSALLAAACANPGTGPDGGPYDETPPHIVGMTPQLGARASDARRVTLQFDELVRIQNASEKVIVSPPQTEMPEIRVAGRRITVELLDTLRPNTTYTIDFSDAIEDSNEGNPLGNFTYYFSTGADLDTMEVAGHVLQADNLEPIKGILVGLHADLADSAFTAKPFDRVAKTDGSGHFSIKGVAPGAYRVYALRDMDNDFKMSRGEMMAFMRDSVVTSSFPDVRYDTLWRDTVRYDTIYTVHYTHYMPDNVVLLAFNEKDTRRYFLKTERPEPEWFRVYFTAPSPQVPRVRGLNFNADSLLLEERSAGNDTITYWLRDTSIPAVDTLRMVYAYDAYDDSLGRNVERTDTLELTPRMTMARRLRQKAEELEKWEKRRERRHKRGDYSDETPPRDYLRITVPMSRTMAPDQNLQFRFAEPLTRLDTAGLHLLLVEDSVEHEAPFELVRAENQLLGFTMRGEWRYGQNYRLVVDSAAVTGLSGNFNKKFQLEFGIGKEESFGSLFLTLPGADSTAVVQLLSSDTKVERQQPARGGRADFFYLRPGAYYLRLFYDRNRNGQWDPGLYAEGRAPEEVFYFPVKLEIRANWDFEQTWRVDELPLTQQKPRELIKQKEETKQTARSRNAERERERGR